MLTEFPTDQQLHEKKSFLVCLGEFGGTPVWLWKTFLGAVLGIILVASTFIGHWNNLKPIAQYSSEKIGHYFQTLDFSHESKGSIVFFPEGKSLLANIESPQVGEFPSNTLVVPVSGSWTG